MNAAHVLHILKQRRLFIFSVTLGVSVLATLIVFMMSPVYRAEVVMVPSVDESQNAIMSSIAGQLGSIASIAGVGAPINGKIDEALAILMSRSFLESFVQDKDLVPVLFPSAVQDGNQRINQTDKPTVYDAYRKLRKDVIRIRIEKASSIILLQVDWVDPKVAANWANSLVERLNMRMREDAIILAKRSIEYLNQELEKSTKIGVQQAIYKLLERQISEIAFANVREQYALRVLDPAAPPDVDDWIRPNRVLAIVLSIVLGIFAGCALSVSSFLLAGRAGDE